MHYAPLFLAPLALFWRVIFADRVLFWGVPLLQFYPWQQFAVEMWRSGHVPLWNPFVGSGAPLAANLQSAVFYPLNVLYLLLPVERAMGYTAVLHVVLAGLAMYAWARTFGLCPLAALIGALTFQLSQFFIARVGFLSITATFPWMAVWLWRAEALVQRRRLSDALWLAVAIGLGLLAGHAQTAGLGLIVVAAYSMMRVVQEAGRRTQSAIRYPLSAIGYLLLALLIGLALAAIQLFPSAELTAQSQRAGGLNYEFAATHSLYPLRLLTFLVPDLMGNPAYGNFWGYDNYWENAGYVGIWALLMAVFACALGVRGWNQRLAKPGAAVSNQQSITVWFFGVTAVLSLLIALGRFAPFYPLLFRALPGAALFQGPARLLSVYTLAAAALAAIGTERLLAGDRLHLTGRILIVAGVGVLMAAFVGERVANVRAELVRPVLRFGVTLCACAACLAFRPVFASRRHVLWQAALISVVVLDLLAADWQLNPLSDVSLYRTPTGSAQAVRAAGSGRLLWFAGDEEEIKFRRYFSFKGFGPEDVAYWLGAREALLPNTAMIEHLPGVNNFDSLVPRHYNDVMTLLDGLTFDEALRAAGAVDARYIISPRDLPLPVVHRGADVTVYCNDRAVGRAWIVPQARVVTDSLAALADPSFDPRQAVLLELGDAPELPAREFAEGRSFVTLQDSPNAVTIRAGSESGGFLVLADVFYPGWQAALDDRPVKVLRANHAFRAIVFPPGEHVVVFRYAPLSFTLGVAISLVALGVSVGLAFVHSRAHRFS